MPPGVHSANATYGNFGTQVAYADTDYAPRFNVIAAASAHIARLGTGAGADTDTYYLHFGASGDTTSTISDVVLTGGTKGGVTSPTVTFGSVSATNFVANVRSLEADGRPGYTPGDFLYYDGDGSGTLNVVASGFADIRLVTATAITPGTATITAGEIVTAASQLDLTAAGTVDGLLPDTATFQAQTFELKWTDKDGNGLRGVADPVILSAAGANARTFYNVGDVWMNHASDGSFGTRVTSSTTKEIPLLTDLSPTALLAGNAKATDASTFIHFPDPDGTDGATATVLMGDVVINSGTIAYATRTTTPANGYGTVIPCTTNLQAALFYIDVDGVNGFTGADPVYINRPATCFGGSADALALTVDDIRVTPITIGTMSRVAGSIVINGEADLATYGAQTANPVAGRWFVSQYNEDGANHVPLALLANGKIHDQDADTTWDANEGVYIATGATVAAGDIRLLPDTSQAACGTCPASTTTTKTAVLATDTDFGRSLVAPASGKLQVYVTGGDTAFDANKNEYVYLSADAFVNANDGRAIANPAGAANSIIALGAADTISNSLMGSAERLFFSWCLTAGSTACAVGNTPLLLHTNDVEVVAAATLVSPTSTDHVPYLERVAEAAATQRLLRWNNGDAGIFDDGFYISLPQGDVTRLNADDLRLVGVDSTRAAGKAVQSSALESGAAVGDLTFSAVSFHTLLAFVDTNSNGYDKGDFVVIDMPAALGGGNVGTYGSADVRLTPTGASAGATANPAGTIHTPPDADTVFTALGAFCPTVSTFHACAAGDAFHVYRFDKNRDNVLDVENKGEDRMYVMANAGPTEDQSAVITPLINSVRIVGDGGATGPTGTPAGAGGGSGVTLPTLSEAAASAGPCVAAGASVPLSVKYTDSLNRAPTTMNAALNSITSTMTAGASTYSSGVTYTATATAPTTAGTYATTFTFANAGGSATLAGPSIVVMPTTNVAPTLASGSVSPASGAAGASYTWTVTYTDLNNNAPTTKVVKIDGVDNVMSSTDTTFCDGAVFTFSKTLLGGAHTFVFEFNDGTTAVKLPGTDTSAGPTITGGPAAPPSGTVSSSPSKSPAKPTPGLEAVAIAAAVGLAILIIVRRRP